MTDGDGLWEGPEFSPDGSEIAFVGFARPKAPDCTHFVQLWTVPRGGGTPRNLLEGIDEPWATRSAAIGARPVRIGSAGCPTAFISLVSERGTSNVRRWRDGLHDVTVGSRRVMDFSIDRGRMAFTTSDATHPPEIALRDLGNGEGADHYLPQPGDHAVDLSHPAREDCLSRRRGRGGRRLADAARRISGRIALSAHRLHSWRSVRRLWRDFLSRVPDAGGSGIRRVLLQPARRRVVCMASDSRSAFAATGARPIMRT